MELKPSSNIEDSSKYATKKSMDLIVSQLTSSKKYTIEFDADGKIKIVTNLIQTPGQSLSDEIEDHYFKEKTEYKPKEFNQYTVTVTTYQDGKITITI